MRHYLSLLAGGIVLAAVFVGCTAEVENPEVDITSIRCSIAQIDVEEDFATGILDTLSVTKATITGSSFLWSAGDRIGILPNTGSQIYFAVTNGAGTSSASFDGGDWAMKSTGTFYAYYPLYPDIFLTKDHVPVSYIGQTQSGNNNTLHTGEYWTLFTGGTTAVGNTLNFSFNHMTSFFKTYVTVPAGTYTKISFTAPSNIFIKEGYFDLSAQTPAIVGTTMTDELTLNLENVTFAEETELSGYLVVAPVDIAGVPITVTVFKDGVATYEYTLAKANNMVASKTYAFRATALTQLASSVSQANTLFASGATAVTITEPLTENATVVLPNTTEAVTLILPTTTSSSKLTVSYDQGAQSYPATLAITGPEGADLDIQTPNSTVTVNGVAYHQITSRTAANTCIIPAGVTVTTLKVIQGGVQVYGTVSQIDLREQEDDAIINVSGTVASLIGEDDEEYVPATGVSLNKSSTNLNVGATETLTATVAPVGAYPKVIWSSSDEAVATVSSTGVVTALTAGSATITAKTISGGFTVDCEVNVTVILDYVDLGLSVMWATCNLCESGFVSSPELNEDYYVWGETEPYYSSKNPLTWKNGKSAGYSWVSYKWCNGSYTTLTKYNTSATYGSVDNRVVMMSIDDAAHIKLGGNWRIPTVAEWTELEENCSWMWTTLNDVKGYRVTSNINGNSIFLPTTGGAFETTIYNDGNGANYWSLSIDSEYPSNAWEFGFNQYAVGLGAGDRIYGRPIRPVLETHNYVDLGLPSGRKWATTNIGARSPQDNGEQFAWGETSTKVAFGWDNYKYGGYDPSDNDYTLVSKYSTDGMNTYSGTADNKTTLDLSDDAAYVNWGEEWRMPYIDEWNELISNCTWTWTTLNTVNGYLVTGPNGSSIFLPVTEYSNYYGEDIGTYWSKDLNSGSYDDTAWVLTFTHSWKTANDQYERAAGQYIRPVLRQ